MHTASSIMDSRGLQPLRPLGTITCAFHFDLNTADRLLGALERYMTTRSFLGIYNNVAVTAEYRCVPENLSIFKATLFRALAAVITQHPVLFAIPVGITSDTPIFVRLPFINIERLVHFNTIERNEPADVDIEAAPLDRLLEQLHNQPFDYTTPPSPFWKIHVLRDPEKPLELHVIFLFHHCLVDTKSALVIHEALERALNVTNHNDYVSHVAAPESPLLYPLDHFICDIPYTQHQPPRHDFGDRWTGAPQSFPARTRFRSYRLPANTSNLLLLAARTKQTTLTAALETILVAALFQIVPDKYGFIRCDCAISLRPLFATGIDAHWVGCYVDNLTLEHSRFTFHWEEVAATKLVMDCVLKQKTWDNLCAKVAAIPHLKSWFHAQMGTPRTSALELSNVGKFGSSQDDKSSYEVRNFLFSQAAGACSGAIKVSCITGPSGQISLGFSWQEGIVEDCLIKSLQIELVKVIERALNG